MNVGSKERIASPKPSKPKMRLRWSPTGKMFDIKGKLIASSESNGDNAFTHNPQELTIKLFLNSTFSLSRVYFVEGLGYKFSVGQFCDSNLKATFRRNTCIVRNLKVVDLLKGNRTTNLYTINLHDMAYASPICLMAWANSTESWLMHQLLSHLNFDTINDFSRYDLVTVLPKFKYHKEHICPSCEQGKRKRASHPPKPVLNSKQRLYLLHMDLCGPMRITSINGKRALCYPKNDREDIGKLCAKVIEFGDSYKVPTNTDPDNATTRKDDEQSGRSVTITTEDMQRKKNDVKARTTLLLSLPDEHQLRFNKFKSAKELWAAILKTFGGNEATKKRKKNLLK
uniref:Retrovirus-related Pol polyprotein from transposon TNT 1-94 n=1 Tax=Tanacetum cinerariifolium TaxID=118510 RepID=A0A699IUB1_TANCI|nr:retrovirus-related Pol polyprotein from transposon TNT 1-94 [Tanacetum cinerariifolium]